MTPGVLRNSGGDLRSDQKGFECSSDCLESS